MPKKQYPKNWIKEIRDQRGLSVRQLADMTGISQPYITMLEKSQRRLYYDNIQKLAAALECHPLDITDGPGNMIVARNDREKEVLRIMRQMQEGEQETFSAGLKAFASAREKQGLTEPEKPLDKKDDKRNR
jgi:transcriptional regulator with XRE-family HTH domain